MFERFTVSARRAVVNSQGEARALKHDHVRAVHLLLGVMTAEDASAGAVLASVGVDPEAVRNQIIATQGLGKDEPSGHIPFSDEGKKAFENSLRVSLDMGHKHIATDHMLLGLIADRSGEAAEVLTALGVQTEAVRKAVIDRLGAVTDEPTEP
jgi:ATP-dependent Clp protease ATP-binding subunit ClpC